MVPANNWPVDTEHPESRPRTSSQRASSQRASSQRASQSMKGVNERVRLVGVGAVTLIVVLFAMLNYLQIFHANALDNNPHNTRGIISEYEQPRGAILSADGVTLAQSVPSNDQYKYQRVYPTGTLFGQITGYFSLTYGTDGLESQYNSALTEATPL